MITTTGKIWNEYLKHLDCEPRYCIDNDDVKVNGAIERDMTHMAKSKDIVTFSSGYIFKYGCSWECANLVNNFKNWIKYKDNITINVTLKKSQRKEFLAYIRANKMKAAK